MGSEVEVPDPRWKLHIFFMEIIFLRAVYVCQTLPGDTLYLNIDYNKQHFLDKVLKKAKKNYQGCNLFS